MSKQTTFAFLIAEGALEIGDGYRAKLEELGGDGPIFLRAGLLGDQGFRWGDAEHFTMEAVARVASKMGRAGDTMVTTKGNSVGRTGYVPKSAPQFVYSPHLSYWRSLDRARLNPRFLYYWSRSPQFISQLMAMAHGTDMAPYLSLTDQRRLKISLPGVTIQAAIGTALGALDDKIASNISTVQAANELAQVIFVEMFERCEPMISVRLGDLADVIDCLHSQKPRFIEGGRRYLVLADIRDDSRIAPSPKFTISTDDYVEWTRRIEAREGDCLITNVGRVGAVGQIPRGLKAAIGRNMTAIRGRQECPPAYLVEALRSATVRREIDVKTDEGTVMSALNVRSIPNLLVPAGQMQDRRSFQDRVGGLHDLQDKLLQENAQLAITRDTLLPKLMSGQIRVRDAERIVEDAT